MKPRTAAQREKRGFPPVKPKKVKKAKPVAEAPKPVDPIKLFAERWQRGEKLPALAAEAGFKRGKFRRMLTAALGGKDTFRALRAQGAGGARAREAATSGPRIDDSHVPMTVGCTKSDGWTSERTWRPTLVSIKLADGKANVASRELVQTVHISPTGVPYVVAADTEQADLIVLSKTEGIQNVRLRIFHGSIVAKQLSEEEELLERGKAALAATREAKRAKRALRKAKPEPEPEPEPPRRKKLKKTKKGGRRA